MHAIRARIRAYRRGDAGGITGEYALLALVGATLAGILLKIVTSDSVRNSLTNLILKSMT